MLLGVNLAVASVLMQGCKATKPRGGEQPPPDRPVAQQRPAQQPAPKTAAQHDIEAKPYTEAKAQPQTVAKPQTPPSAQPQAQQATAQTPADKTAQGATARPAQPQAEAKALPPPEPEYTEYIVKRGDILSRICVKHGIKQRDVLKLNPGLNPNLLYVGKKIRLPITSAAPAAAKPVKEAKDSPAKDVKPAAKGDAANVKAPVTKKSAYKPYDGPTKEYIVKSGDQIGKIALAYGITARALKEMNGLSDNNIRVGQKLKVPAEKVKAEAKAAEPAAKDVKKDDAKKDDAKAEAKADEKKDDANAETKADEKKDDAKEEAKDDAKKDDAKAENNAEPAPAPAPEPPAPAEPLTYVVKEGEDAIAIAINFGISPSALMDLNDLKPTDKLRAGQVLKLPPCVDQPAAGVWLEQG